MLIDVLACSRFVIIISIVTIIVLGACATLVSKRTHTHTVTLSYECVNECSDTAACVATTREHTHTKGSRICVSARAFVVWPTGAAAAAARPPREKCFV